MSLRSPPSPPRTGPSQIAIRFAKIKQLLESFKTNFYVPPKEHVQYLVPLQPWIDQLDEAKNYIQNCTFLDDDHSDVKLENFLQKEGLAPAPENPKSPKLRRSYSDDLTTRVRPDEVTRGGSDAIFSKPISLTLSPSSVPSRVRKHRRSKSGTYSLSSNLKSSDSPTLSHAQSYSLVQKEKKRAPEQTYPMDRDWAPPNQDSKPRHRRAKSGFIVMPKIVEPVAAPTDPKLPEITSEPKQRHKRAHSGFITLNGLSHKVAEAVAKRVPQRERPRSAYFTPRELKRMRTIKNDYIFDSDGDDNTTTVTTQNDPSSNEWSVYSIRSGGTCEPSSSDRDSKRSLGSIRRMGATKSWDLLTSQKIKSLQEDIKRKDPCQDKVRPYEIPKLERTCNND